MEGGAYLFGFLSDLFQPGSSHEQKTIASVRHQLREQNMAFRDSLTGLGNWRKLIQVIDHTQQRSHCVVLADIDHFKRFNGQHGRQKGDEILIEISTCISNSMCACGIWLCAGVEKNL